MSDMTEMSLAVLIDADNVVRSDMNVVIGEIAKYGTPVIKRAYGDWSSSALSGWKEVLLDIGAVPIQQYAYTTGKNATDVAMVIDAMDFLHNGDVDGFVLVSSDSDFTPLALRLRESGKKVFGIGEKKTPRPFIKACDKFIYVEILRPAYVLAPTTVIESDSSTSTRQPGPLLPMSVKSHCPTQPVDKHETTSCMAAPLPANNTASPKNNENQKVSQATAASSVKKAVTAKTVAFIAQCISEIANDDGRCTLANLGSLISKNRPDFDSRNYGYSQLSKLLKSIDRFQVTGSGATISVKDKSQNS